MIPTTKRLAGALVPLVTIAFATGAGTAAASPCGHGHSQAGHSEHAEHSKQGAAHEQHAAEADADFALHGGAVSMTKHGHYETVVDPDGIRVYRYTAKQTPAVFGAGAGTATLSFPDGTRRDIALARADAKDGEKTAYFCPGHPQATRMEPGICEACGSMKLVAQDYLFGPYDFSESGAAPTKAVVRLEGMEGKESEATFSVKLAAERRAADAPKS